MPPIVPLSSEKHKNIRIKPNNDLAHMKDQNVVTVSIKEMSRAVNNYPVVFVKQQNDDQYRLVALLGFAAGENLYYDEDEWACTYAPLVTLREPFVIGPDGSEDTKRLVTCLDEGSPYVSETEGDALYNEDGSESDLLKNTQQLLSEIFDGEVKTHKFMQRMQQLDLIGGVDIALETESGKKNRYTGICSIDEKKLKALDNDVMIELLESEYLPLIYMILSSLGQFNMMVKLRNKGAEDRVAKFQIRPAEPVQEVNA